MKLILALFAFFAFSACHSTRENVDGGSCSFRYDSSAIRVVKIEQQGKDTTFNIFFRYVDRNDSLDTTGDPVIYSVLNNGHHVGQSEVEHYGVKPGYTCTLIESQTISGGCGGGHIISLEPWRGAGMR